MSQTYESSGLTYQQHSILGVHPGRFVPTRGISAKSGSTWVAACAPAGGSAGDAVGEERDAEQPTKTQAPNSGVEESSGDLVGAAMVQRGRGLRVSWRSASSEQHR